jgi:hypothetical protein
MISRRDAENAGNRFKNVSHNGTNNTKEEMKNLFFVPFVPLCETYFLLFAFSAPLRETPFQP